MVQLMPLPSHHLELQCNQENGFTFLVPAYLGCHGKEAVKRVFFKCVKKTSVSVTGFQGNNVSSCLIDRISQADKTRRTETLWRYSALTVVSCRVML